MKLFIFNMFTVFFTITIVRSLFLKIFQNKITSFKNITKYFLPVPFAFFAFVLNTILYVVVIEILGGELQEQSRLGSAMFYALLLLFSFVYILHINKSKIMSIYFVSSKINYLFSRRDLLFLFIPMTMVISK